MAPPPSLDDLIKTVQRDAASADPLDQLAAASSTVSQIAETSDALLGHYVDRARGSGKTWTEISAVLGVSKQAVHKRFSSSGVQMPTYERFTQRTRAVLAKAQEVSAAAGHEYVGTEHVLLALFAQPESIATKILAAHNITRDKVEAEIPAAAAGQSSEENPPLSKILSGALTEAVDRGHNYVGTEHLLLAIDRHPHSVGATVLRKLELTADQVRADVAQALAGFQA
jgi:ATP-dependent Clp protease ATP-binding subunit ClpA